MAAAALGFTDDLRNIVAAGYTDVVRTEKIAALLKGRGYDELVAIVESIPVVEDAAAVVKELQQKGYVCGIISDSYTCITEHVKVKLNMDFSCANVLDFENDIAAGTVSIPHNFLRLQNSDCAHDYCKCNMMHHIRGQYAIDAADVLAIGDGVNDICMISRAGTGVAFNATHARVNEVADMIVDERSFRPVLEIA